MQKWDVNFYRNEFKVHKNKACDETGDDEELLIQTHSNALLASDEHIEYSSVRDREWKKESVELSTIAVHSWLNSLKENPDFSLFIRLCKM